MRDLGIGEVGRRVGLQPSAVRYYESVGLLPEPRRVGGKRRYDEGAVRQLQLIQLAQAAGFRLAEVRELLHGFAPETPPAERWQRLAPAKLHELDELLARVQQMRQLMQAGLDCSCRRLEDCAAELARGKPDRAKDLPH